MSYIANPKNFSQAQAIEHAKNGLMHFSECQDECFDPDREFFATREEAEESATEKSGYDTESEIEYAYETRSMWFDDYGYLIIAEDEDEIQATA